MTTPDAGLDDEPAPRVHERRRGRLVRLPCAEVDLARLERDLPIAGHDEQPAIVVDPGASPSPLAQRTGYPCSASRARTRSSTWARIAAEPPAQRVQQPLQRRLDRVGPSPSVPARSRARAGNPQPAQRHVEPDPDDGPALLRPALDQDPRDLAPVDEDVVGPLQLAPPSPTTSATATPAASGSSRGGSRITTRAQQRPAPAARSTSVPWRPRRRSARRAVTSVPCGRSRARRARGRARSSNQ